MTFSIGQAIDVDEYFDRLEQWLEMEAEAERERLARRRQLRDQTHVERTGETLLQMEMVDHDTGLAGRLLLEFCKPGGVPLPMNRLKVGSPVVISDQDDPEDRGIAGVVSRKRNDKLQVATEAWPEARRYRIDLSPDETTRRRQLAAMAKARMATGRAAKLRDVLLGHRVPRFTAERQLDFATRLNPPQQDAVRFALSAQDVAVIHGPPGTGKTTTLSEVIYQAVERGDRVLACAPSNTAVDNLLERLVTTGLVDDGALRVGHPARVFEALRGHTLDELVDNDPSTAVVREMRREVQELMRAASRGFRGRDGRRRRGELFAEAGRLRGQIRSLERSVIQSVLDRAAVICTTTTIDDDLLGNRQFDLVVIDEACQATLQSVWQAVLRADRVIFAGDHRQLPPTVLSEQAALQGMRESTMQHLVQREGSDIYRRLTVQYRMHAAIMAFSSKHFYEDTLIADDSVAQHRLCDLPGVATLPLTSEPLQLIDTAGAEFQEQVESDGESKFNAGEARLVAHLVRVLRESGVEAEQIGVIAPYAAQVRLIRDLVDERAVEVDTVDGFQGREKEAIVLTMVRSNDRQQIGFLADTRRTNVALTRARRKLIVIGDSATLANHKFYAALLDHFDHADAYHSVYEYDF